MTDWSCSQERKGLNYIRILIGLWTIRDLKISSSFSVAQLQMCYREHFFAKYTCLKGIQKLIIIRRMKIVDVLAITIISVM